jgi:hypothetical protein
MWATFLIFKNLLKVNNNPVGDLVTLTIALLFQVNRHFLADKII